MTNDVAATIPLNIGCRYSNLQEIVDALNDTLYGEHVVVSRFGTGGFDCRFDDLPQVRLETITSHAGIGYDSSGEAFIYIPVRPISYLRNKRYCIDGRDYRSRIQIGPDHVSVLSLGQVPVTEEPRTINGIFSRAMTITVLRDIL